MNPDDISSLGGPSRDGLHGGEATDRLDSVMIGHQNVVGSQSHVNGLKCVHVLHNERRTAHHGLVARLLRAPMQCSVQDTDARGPGKGGRGVLATTTRR